MAFEKNFFFPSDFGFMRDFVFVFLVCRGLRLFLGCVWWWVGVSHLGFSLPLADGVPAPPPRRRSRVLGQEIRVTQHPWVLGALLETLLGTGLVLGVRLVLGTRQAVTL